MARAILGAAAIAVLLSTAGSIGTSVPAAAANNNTGAVVGGLVAGAIIGAAVAGSVNHPANIYVNPKPPPPPPGPNPWKNAFSPKPGITCYPVQKACYNNNGAYNANWTWKVYSK
jgi:hypothetical protein